MSQNSRPIAFFSKKLNRRLSVSSINVYELYGLTGKDNIVADALSRITEPPIEEISAYISSPFSTLISQLQSFFPTNPEETGRRLEILQEFHASPLGGHFGIQAPLAHVSASFYMPLPQQVWDEISMYFITNLPQANNKTTIWVIVDCLTKFAHFITLPANFTATTLAQIFISKI